MIAGEVGFHAVRLLSATQGHPQFPIFATALGSLPSLGNGRLPDPYSASMYCTSYMCVCTTTLHSRVSVHCSSTSTTFDVCQLCVCMCWMYTYSSPTRGATIKLWSDEDPVSMSVFNCNYSQTRRPHRTTPPCFACMYMHCIYATAGVCVHYRPSVGVCVHRSHTHTTHRIRIGSPESSRWRKTCTAPSTNTSRTTRAADSCSHVFAHASIECTESSVCTVAAYCCACNVSLFTDDYAQARFSLIQAAKERYAYEMKQQAAFTCVFVSYCIHVCRSQLSDRPCLYLHTPSACSRLPILLPCVDAPALYQCMNCTGRGDEGQAGRWQGWSPLTPSRCPGGGRCNRRCGGKSGYSARPLWRRRCPIHSDGYTDAWDTNGCLPCRYTGRCIRRLPSVCCLSHPHMNTQCP